MIDFYRLIDTIDINQIRFTNFYRLTTPGTRVQSHVGLSTTFQLSEENKLNYANVYRNTVKDGDSQTYSHRHFFAGGWKGRLYTMGGDTEITQSRTNLIVQIQTKNKNSGPH